MPAVEEHREKRDRRKAEDFLCQPDHLEVEDGSGYNIDNKTRLLTYSTIRTMMIRMMMIRMMMIRTMTIRTTMYIGASRTIAMKESITRTGQGSL